MNACSYYNLSFPITTYADTDNTLQIYSYPPDVIAVGDSGFAIGGVLRYGQSCRGGQAERGFVQLSLPESGFHTSVCQTCA